MIYHLYSVKDLKSGFLPTTYDQNDEAAKRNFILACRNNKNGLFFQFPADYQFWHVGTFDNETGEIKEDLRFICDAPQNFEKEVSDNE